MIRQYNVKFFMLFLMLMAIGNFSCDQICYYKSLSPMDCNPGYIPVNDIEFKTTKWGGWMYPLGQIVIINDDSSYKVAFGIPVDSTIQIPIDFSSKSLVGAYVDIDYGSDIKYQECFCYNPEKDKWLYKIEYTLHHQCKDGHYSSDIFFHLVCPKLPPGAIVELDEKNINPR